MGTRKGQKINRPPKPLAERFARHYAIDEKTGCWLWTAYVDPGGYGTISDDRGRVTLLAHRVSYETHVGSIPEGLTIDHLCRVRHCVNPAHLEAVSMRENNRRGHGWAGRNATKTHCVRGHSFTEENTYWNPDGEGRRCRECMREDTRAWRRRRVA